MRPFTPQLSSTSVKPSFGWSARSSLAASSEAIRLAAETSPLVKDVTDPLIETSFLCTQGAPVAPRRRGTEKRSSCANRHSMCQTSTGSLLCGPTHFMASAIAHTGLREFAIAAAQIDQAEESAGTHDLHIAMYAAASRARIAIGAAEIRSRPGARLPELGKTRLRADESRTGRLSGAGARTSWVKSTSAPVPMDEVHSLPGATIEARVLAAGARAVCSTHTGSHESTSISLSTAVTRHGPGRQPRHRGSRIPSCLVAVADVCDDRDWLREVLRQSNDFKLARPLDLELARPSSADAAKLTPREHEVARLVALGYRNREIGDKLFISEATVKVHVRHIREKVGGSSRTELAARVSTCSTSRSRCARR